MTIWRIIIPAITAGATLAACITYLVTPPFAIRAAIQGGPHSRLKTLSPAEMGSRNADFSEEEEAAAAYLDAAQAILRRAPNARASTDKQPLREAIPLPRRRPIPHL